MNKNHSTVAILGAGPIGVEALLVCIENGFDAVLYERDEVGGNIKKWEHVRLFSPFVMNRSNYGAEKLANSSVSLPGDQALLSGKEYLTEYLLPLTQLPALQGAIRTHANVEQIGKVELLKSDLIGSSKRAEHCFRLLINQQGLRTIVTAEYVFDCTGTFGNHNWFGNGGIPCPGEQESRGRIHYGLPDIHEVDRQKYLGKATLVIGSGYSAATNVVGLAELCKENSSTQVTWLTRHNRDSPLLTIENDSLTERDALIQAANKLVHMEGTGVRWIANSIVESITSTAEKDTPLNVKIRYRGTDDSQLLSVDNIVANVGFRPDRSIYEELQVHECYASQGPMKLAASLMGETSSDCLAQSSHGIQSLKSPEPNFYILGAKSYGRNSRFLIKAGLEQVAEVVEEIAQSKING